MKAVLFHPQAEAELDASIDFYEHRERGLGVDLEYEVAKALQAIEESPMRWPADHHGARSLLLERFPFRIVYLDLPDVLWVIAVAHCARRPGYWLERLRGDQK